MALTKSDILIKICNETQLTKNQSSEILEAMIKIIKTTLETGDEIMISGFGKFFVRDKNQRNGRNPASGEGMLLEARKVVRFQSSKKLKAQLNKPKTSIKK